MIRRRLAQTAKLRCAVFALTTNWFVDLMLCARGLAWCYIRPPEHSAVAGRNPYHLPEDSNADFVLISSDMAKALSSAGQFYTFAKWAGRVSGGLIGMDTHDVLRLSMEPHLLGPMDLVLKAQGVYRDKDLYNWKAGSFYGGKSWTTRDSRGPVYASRDLEKLRCSLPCFLAIDPKIRQRLRAKAAGATRGKGLVRYVGYQLPSLYQWIPLAPAGGVFFVGSLTHLQRLEAVRMLRESGIPGCYGITGVPDLYFGAQSYTVSRQSSQQERDQDSLDTSQLFIDYESEHVADREPQLVLKTLDGGVLTTSEKDRSRASSILAREHLAKRTVSLTTIHWKAWRHRMIFAPTGYGELTFRHGEALRAGRTLICQDLSHVDTLFPFENGRNVIYCKSDLSDLVDTIRSVSASSEPERIGHAGKRDWQDWTRSADRVLHSGISSHLSRAG